MHGGQSPLGPLALLVVVLASDAWVFTDARRRAERHDDVVASLGSLELATPGAWFLACVLLWVLFFPMYLVARSR